MKLWLEGERVKLGPDLSRVESVYRKGVLVEGRRPQTPREWADTRTLVAMLDSSGVLRRAA